MAKEKLGALWERESKNGAKYFGGTLTIGQDRIKIVAFPNKYKAENPSQPDWNIYESEQRSDA